uniref:N-acyl-aliphatic-L-amino acid amidohydrolase n=1 Tax=Leptobrachium leishanense TaxID=445787 RepID=A0A8C5QGH1_9ANUR
MSSSENPSTSLFREYLRIRTVHPDPDYDGAEEFLVRVAKDIGLESRKVKLSSGRDILVMTWQGTDPKLKSVILNSHIDVVPVYEDLWTHPPFAAHKDEAGNIYARGTQDMKCVTIQYLEALRQLKSDGSHFPRTIHLTLVPDEETGGHTGMELFVDYPEFKDLNPGITLDEGLASPTEEFSVFYGEKCPWCKSYFTSSFHKRKGQKSYWVPAGPQYHQGSHKALKPRLGANVRSNKLESDPSLSIGDVTTVNLTKLSGGILYNVVPSIMSVTFDLRVQPTLNLKKPVTSRLLFSFIHLLGFFFLQKCMNQNITSIDESYPWWKAGYPALGFSPMNHTPILLHDHNEYLNEDVFLRGIHIYNKIISSLASVPAFDEEL